MTNRVPPSASSLPPGQRPPILPRYLAIAGPTACGKTAAALAIAQRYPVEIISVDSALVYRGMDIGTAKPSALELATVPHHLIDIRDPLHAYSAADFARDATALMHAITARGRLPLLVGGTMLYFKALRDGLDDMPPANADIRQALEQEAAQKGWPALHAELTLIDPLTAARLAPLDSQRIARALEVYRITGLPLSQFHTIATTSVASSAYSIRATSQNDLKNASNAGDPADHPDAAADDASSTTTEVAASALPERATGLKGLKNAGEDALLISLEPQHRTWLHQRIAQRFDAMLAAGFLDEVKGLRARSDLHPDLPAMRCVGYRQAWEYLDAMEAPLTGIAAYPPRSMKLCRSGALAAHSDPRIRGEGAAPTEQPVLVHVKTPVGPSPLADFREKSLIATRQLAKRQMTWLRSMADRHVVACDAPDALQQVLAQAASFIDHPGFLR